MTLDKPPSKEVVPLEITPATHADIEQIVALHKRSYSETYPNFTATHTREEDLAHFSEVVDTQEVHVARDGEKVVGYIAFTDGEVSKLYLDPSVQGQGLGKTLLDIPKAKNNSLSLWTYQANENARRFYEKQGFVAVEKTDGETNEENQPDVRFEWHRDEQS